MKRPFLTKEKESYNPHVHATIDKEHARQDTLTCELHYVNYAPRGKKKSYGFISIQDMLD